MDKLCICLTVVVAAVIISPIPLLFNIISPVDAASRDSRTDAYRRSIDICIRCTQPGPPGQSPSPDLVHIVWHDFNHDNWPIGTLKNTRNFMGVFLNPVTDLDNNAAVRYGPAIAASESNVYVVWQDSVDILFKRSTDGGATFGSTINLSNNPEPSVAPQIAASGNNVYVVWQDDSDDLGNAEVLYRRSTDGGATFGSTINLSNNQGFSGNAVISVSGNNVYVAWNDNVLGNHEILYRRSTDGGATFGTTVNLSNNAGGSNHASIAASGNNYISYGKTTLPEAMKFIIKGVQMAESHLVPL